MVPLFAVGASVAIVGVYDLLRSRAFARAAITIGVAVAIIALLRIDYLGIRRATSGFAALTMAQDRLDTGDVDAAITGLERLRSEGSVRAPEVHLTLARAYLRRGSPQDLDAAFRVAEEALRDYPEEPELLWYSAVGHAARKNWTMVRQRITRFLDLEPDNLRALFLGFTGALELGDQEDARTFLDRAVAVDANDPIVGEMRKRLAQAPPP
jgi:tetratricopeptide (TPR) repeat protein